MSATQTMGERTSVLTAQNVALAVCTLLLAYVLRISLDIFKKYKKFRYLKDTLAGDPGHWLYGNSDKVHMYYNRS